MKRILLLLNIIVCFILFLSAVKSDVFAVAVSCPEYNRQSPVIGQRCPKEASPGYTLTCGVNNRFICTCSQDRPCLGDPSDIDARTKIVAILNLDADPTPTPTPQSQVTGYPYCPGQCKGEASVNKKSIGTICTGIDNFCYRCDSAPGTLYGGTFTKVSSSLCPTGPTATPVSNPSNPPVGSCDGCMDPGSCTMRKGSWTAQTTGTCAPQGGYCNGTTFCGGGSGLGATPAPLNKACGDKCNSNADCRNPSTNGSPTACINGTCQNTMCAAGMTIPGANCSCGANTRKCGQTCSGTVGLCGPGQGYCTYVNPPKHWYTGQPDCAWGSTAYCASNKNGYVQTQCATGDAPGGHFLTAPNGATTGITTTDMQKSCQVCGNGDIEIGEQCDDGAKNGTPGSSCTATTCMKVTCGMTCTTDASCGATQHIVRIVRNSAVANAVLAVDSVLDKDVYADGSPLLVPGGATWSVVADPTAHGATYLSSALPGATLTYKTYSPNIILNVKGGSTSSAVDVFVDGILKSSIKDLTAKSGWVAVPITISSSNQYSCVKTGATSVCRLAANPGSSICEIPPVAPTPIPTPTPLVCNMSPTITSTGSATSWKIGDKITFNLGVATSAGLPITTKIRYEGQVATYRGTTKVSVVDLTPINASASQFQPMTVNAVNATYYYRFRYCVTNAANVETCSAWGNWAAPAVTATAAPATTTASPVPIAPGTLCTSASGCICTNSGRLMKNTWTCP